MRKVYWIVFFGLIACYPAIAAQMTVGDLQSFCSSSNEVQKTACSFYIWGVTEGASLGSGSFKDSSGAYRERKDKPFCVPEGVDKAEVELAVSKKMAEDLTSFPEDREMPSVSFVTAVIAGQFPCVKAK